MKILVAIDDSEASLHALKVALAMSKAWAVESEFILINAHRPIAHADPLGFTTGLDRPYLENLSQSELRPAMALAKTSGVVARTVTKIGPIAESIVEFADEDKVDMIVLGTKGRSNLADVLMGSIARQVASLARMPVLLVPPAQKR